MIHFIKKLFTGETIDNPEEKQAQAEEKHFDILKYDGIRALRIGKFPYAVKCMEEALSIKDDAETRGYLVSAYVQLNQIEDACKLLGETLEKEPQNIDNYIMLGNLFFMQEDYKGMLGVIQRGAQIEPEHPQMHYLLAKAYHGIHDEIQAIAELTIAISLKEDYYEAYLMRATILLKMQQIENASEDAERMFQLAPDDEQSLLMLGEVNYMKGDTLKAEEYFNKATDINPFNEKAYLSIIQILSEEKKWEQAMEKLNEAIEINPESSQLYHHRGHLKLLMGDKEGSAEDLKKSLELNPEKEQQISGEFRNYTNPYKINNPLG